MNLLWRHNRCLLHTTAKLELMLNETLTGIYLTRSIPNYNQGKHITLTLYLKVYLKYHNLSSILCHIDHGRTHILFCDLLRVVPCVCKEHCSDLQAPNISSLHVSDYCKSFLLEVQVYSEMMSLDESESLETRQTILTADTVDECFQICLMLNLW